MPVWGFPGSPRRFARSACACAILLCVTAQADQQDASLDRAGGAVSKQCADAVSSDTGHPVMFWSGRGGADGLSVRSAVYGQPIVLLRWIDNQTDEPIAISSCGLGNFWISEIDVVDASGNRMLDRDSDYARTKGFDLVRGLDPRLVCSSNIPIGFPAKTCSHRKFSDLETNDRDEPDSFLIVDLAALHELPPGEYRIVGRVDAYGATNSQIGLPFTVSDWGIVDHLLHLSTLESGLIRALGVRWPDLARRIGLPAPDADRLAPLLASDG